MGEIKPPVRSRSPRGITPLLIMAGLTLPFRSLSNGTDNGRCVCKRIQLKKASEFVAWRLATESCRIVDLAQKGGREMQMLTTVEIGG